MLRARDIDALYKVLYDRVHDRDEALEITPNSTAGAFSKQWEEFPEGEYLLSDPWFKANVGRILTEQEILLDPSWFKGRKVLDAGCGNGRWTYGLASLGAKLTSVDINQSAIDAARVAVNEIAQDVRFLKSPLEDLLEATGGDTFELVFCWGVAHHCVRFNKVLDALCASVAPGGVLYLYLYGSDSMDWKEESRIFKDRVAYNVLMDDEERMRFLLKKAGGNRDIVHNVHDLYAPLINRRFTFDETKGMLAERGFTDVLRTIDHTEVFVRATRGDVDLSEWSLPPAKPPYWFQAHSL
jgi:SAM-dependent methyltransferase